MLRTQLTRIQLTAADMEGLDDRIIARRLSELEPIRSHARLSLGPRLQTRVATVKLAQDNGKQRVVSPESQAMICAADNLLENLLSPKTKSVDNAQQLVSSSHAANSLKTLLRGGSPTENANHSHNAAQSSKTVEPSRESRHRRRQTAPSNHNITGLDGTHDAAAAASRSASVVPAPLHAGRPVFQELSFISAGSPSTEHRLLSSARARRPRMSSHDDPLTIHEDHVFDPSATVFTPRVRFGSAVTVSDTDSQIAVRPSRTRDERMEPPHTSTELSVRSPSEQNMDPAHRHRPQQDTAADDDDGLLEEEEEEVPGPALLSPRLRHGRAAAAPTRQRRSSENNTRPMPSPNLDRYPLLFPGTGSSGRRRSGSGRSDTTQTGEASDRPLPRVNGTMLPLNTTSPQPDATRPDSPTLANPSLSSPAFLYSVSPSVVTHHRSNSLSWREDGPALSPKTGLIATTSSPASGTSELSTSSRSLLRHHASGELADAAAEFLRARSSPLDRLTAELGRLSATLSSHDPGTPSGRPIKLLNGDPFRQSRSALRERSSSSTTVTHGSPEPEIVQLRGPLPTANDLYPPYNKSSPPRLASDALPPLPDTPAHHSTTAITTALVPLASRSPDSKGKAPLTPVPRHNATTMHKVAIYHDSTPAHLQPQTPADLPRAISRRLRNRSESAVHQEALFVGRAVVPTPVAERKLFRNTYPSALATFAMPSGPSDGANASVGGHVPLLVSQRGVQQQQQFAAELRLREEDAEEEGENDFEGQLVGLESDRHVWLGRHERGEGGLDVTPPKEGRFERYLS